MDREYIHDGREAPVLVRQGVANSWYAELRLERYALAARHFDDLPNRPRERRQAARSNQTQY